MIQPKKTLEDFKVDGKVITAESSWRFLEWYGAVRRDKREDGTTENIIIHHQKWIDGNKEVDNYLKAQYGRTMELKEWDKIVEQ